MKKNFPKDPKYTKIATYTFITIGALMILWRLILSSNNLWISFTGAFDFLWGSISTIIFGLTLGYILSPGVTFLEKVFNKIFNKKKVQKREKRIRVISIVLLYIIIIAGIALIVVFIIPPLAENTIQFSESLPDYIDKVIKWYDANLKDSPLFTSEYTKEIMDNSRNTLTERLNEIVLTIVTTLANSIFSIFSSVIKFAIAFIIAFYFLLSAKDVVSGVSEFGRLRLGEERANSVGTFVKSVIA